MSVVGGRPGTVQSCQRVRNGSRAAFMMFFCGFWWIQLHGCFSAGLCIHLAGFSQVLGRPDTVGYSCWLLACTFVVSSWCWADPPPWAPLDLLVDPPPLAPPGLLVDLLPLAAPALRADRPPWAQCRNWRCLPFAIASSSCLAWAPYDGSWLHGWHGTA